MYGWLDDERDAPSGGQRCRTPDEAIGWVRSGLVAVLSLDHDLGDDAAGTGYDVITWIENRVHEDVTFRPPCIEVHTANPAARQRMRAAVAQVQKAYMANCRTK